MNKSKLKLILLSILVGILAGSASALFLSLLKIVTSKREAHDQLIFLLPIGGFAVAWSYYKFGKNSEGGNGLIIDEIHEPKKKIPLRMAPFVLIGTITTHLFGGSAGREGTAVQMGASLADSLGVIFKVDTHQRRVLLVSGMGAGFASAIGAPWAGVIFGLEVLSIGAFQWFALLESLIACFVAYAMVGVWGVVHTDYYQPDIPALSIRFFVVLLIAGFIFGVTAVAFSKLAHLVERVNKKFITYPPLRPFIAGLILVPLFFWEGTLRFCGLGLDVIQEALRGNANPADPLYKTFFTALTVGSGFKGGEFIPLVFIGSTMGNVIGNGFGYSAGFFAALGFAAVFGAAANTPIACAVMAIEIFGLQFAPYAVLTCIIAYYFSGHHGVYKTQKIHIAKQDQLLMFFRRFKIKKH